MNDDRFFERLREDARPLQAQPDDAMLTRIAARVRERVAESEPSIATLLARWFRPLAATFAAVVLAASVGIAAFDVEETTSDDSVEIQVAGETFHVE